MKVEMMKLKGMCVCVWYMERLWRKVLDMYSSRTVEAKWYCILVLLEPDSKNLNPTIGPLRKDFDAIR